MADYWPDMQPVAETMQRSLGCFLLDPERADLLAVLYGDELSLDMVVHRLIVIWPLSGLSPGRLGRYLAQHDYVLAAGVLDSIQPIRLGDGRPLVRYLTKEWRINDLSTRKALAAKHLEVRQAARSEAEALSALVESLGQMCGERRLPLTPVQFLAWCGTHARVRQAESQVAA